MDTLKKNLEQREKSELIAIIQQMLHQEPDLQWLLATPLPTTSSQKASIDPEVYQQQVLAAMAAGENQRKRKRGEVQRRLIAIKTIADKFAAQELYAAALTIYEVLVNEIIAHFNDYRDEYVAFSMILVGCIDGLDSCFAGEEHNPEMRLGVIQVLFAIYRFYMDSWMDLDEDIPGLLVGNSTPEERQFIAGWVRDALQQTKAEGSAGYSRQRYEAFLAALEQVARP
ncbi:MAG TPA: hypothetical protein VFZ02_11070 [Ktedonobacteraceae bacterium]|jgi:hypothetical protein